MWIVIEIIVVTLAIIATDAPYLWRQGNKKELWVFSFLLFAGVALNVAQFAMHIILPNPLDAVIYVYKPVSQWVFSMLS